MSQLRTLIWLKWVLFRNSLRRSKAVLNRVASALAITAAVLLSLLVAAGLGAGAYALTLPGSGLESQNLIAAHGGPDEFVPSAEFIFFSILSLIYLLWGTLPLSIGSGRQFDPGNLLLYPISLRKLFALDFLSEIVTLQSLFAIPSLLAMGIGAGLATGKILFGVLASLAAIAFGLALTKWVATTVGVLLRRKRTRGESVVAFIGVFAGLGGALFGQLAPVIFRHADSIVFLRWTPPGAVALALTEGLNSERGLEFILAVILLLCYTLGLVAFTYWLARRSVLGTGRSKRKQRPPSREQTSYTSWSFPLLSPQVSAVVEKEIRYGLRNAQLRMMMLMPLVLVVFRFMNTRRFGNTSGGSPASSDFFEYADGLMATLGMLYVFMILSGLFCNQFAFDHAGMRTIILSPVERRHVLLGKNIAFSLIAFVFCAGLLIVNELIFRDLTGWSLLFAALSFVGFAALMSLLGNWLSIHFPKRMKFGKRLNVSGMVGLLLIPLVLLMSLLPIAATAAGYVTQSRLIQYVTLAILAALSVVFYLLWLPSQGEALQKRELEIHEAVNDPGD